MRQILPRYAGAAVLAVLCAPAPGAFAQQPKTVAEIANYHGTDRQKVFEEGARREGQLLIYAIGTQADPVYKAFGDKYPFIKVAAQRNDSSVMTRLIMEEASANTFNVDAIELTTGGLYPLRDADLLQPYWSPELAAYRKEAIEAGNHWVIDYESYLSLGYNTNLVSETDAPKTYDDLLDPKWKGKMALPGTTTMANWLGAVLREKDEAYVRKLGQQQIRIYEVSARAVANLVISGEVPLSPAIYNSHVANSQEQGAPIAWRALGGVYPTTDGAVIAAHAPHPFAAMLFVDFVLSTEGQKIFQKLGYSSARTDLPGKDRPAKIYYLGDEPDYLANYEKWTALGRQVFGSGAK
jgi:iron(III) transport system substrate-binding protein